ncbi:MAG: PAS domain S-box protein [Anaerolineae bacterium]|nr:PAS domain S-box protein [Anaerolineae bacterium]
MTGGRNAPSSIDRLNALVARLIEPVSSIQDPTQRREARLLASLLIALVIIGVVAEAAPLIVDPGIRQEVQANPFGTALSVTVIATLAALFFLSRTPRYRLAAALTVVVCWLGIFTFAVRGQSASDFYFLVYLILPVLFASIFFSLRTTFLVFAVSTAGMAFLPILNARADPFEIPLFFFFAVSCLIVIAARHRSLVERDRQAQLVAGEHRYQSVAELTSDFAYALRVEPDGTPWLDWITGAVTPITGYQPDDIDHRIDLTRIAHPEDRPIAAQHLETLLSGQAGVCEFRIIARSGAVRWIRAYGKPVWDKSQGRVVSVYGAVQDITGQKHAQEALKQAHDQLERRVAERTAALLEANDVLTVEIEERKRVEERLAEERNLLRTLIDNLPDDIFVKDQEGRFLVANNTLARRLGQAEADALIGKTDYDFYPRERADAFQADEQKLLQSGEAIVNKEIAATAPDGSTIWHATTKVPLRDARGDIVGLVGITRDITDQKQIEAALREAQNDLESMWPPAPPN